MRDLGPDPTRSDTDLVAAPACCPGGKCGPVFETPLLQVAFNRIRDLVRNRTAVDTVPAASPHRWKDAPRD